MKITRKQLKRIIKEEMQRTLLTEVIDEILVEDYPKIHETIIVPLQAKITDNERYGVPNWENGHKNEIIKFEIPNAVWPSTQAEFEAESFFDNDDYPNGLELTMTPSTVSDEDLKEYVDKYSDAADELKTLARSLISARHGRQGSIDLPITQDVEYSREEEF